MQRKYVYLLVALLTFFVGVTLTISFVRQKQNSQNLPTAEKASSTSRNSQEIFTIRTPETVKLPNFSQSFVASVEKSKKLKSAVETLKGFSVKADFSDCEGYENISKWNGANPQELYVNQARRWTVDNQPWLYFVSANPPNISVTFSFVYVDDNGDGKFDRCKYDDGLNRVFEMPEWARRRASTKSRKYDKN